MAQKNIDWDFILDLEGFALNGYVPDAKNSKSGVTIASGFDLGARNENDLKGLPNNLIKKLIPYLGLKGLEAESVANSLSITENEAKILNEFSKNKTVNKLKNKWQNFTNTSFDDLPMHQATVIASLSFQYGNLESQTPNFWQQVTNNNWDDADGDTLDQEPEVRTAESLAEKLQDLVNSDGLENTYLEIPKFWR